MRSRALALQTTFAYPDRVEVIEDDPDAFDTDACSIYVEPVDQPADLISEELCFRSPNGTHSYRSNGVHCCYCDMAGPWKRRDACRS